MSTYRSQSGVWRYLEECGVLERGTADEIQAARNAYWKAYRRAWQKTQRTSYTISLTDNEAKELLRAAAKHYRAPTTFIKDALFAYLHSSFVVPDIAAMQEIRILLARNYCLLQTLEENTDRDFESALPLMVRLEEQVLRCLTAPARIAAPQSDSL